MSGRFILSIPAVLCLIAGGRAATLPDPTRPADYLARIEAPANQDKAAVNFELTGIRIDAEDRTAIVNGHLIRVGDTVEGAKLLEIDPASVTLQYEHRRLTLRLFERVSKTAVPESPDHANTTN